MNGESIEQWRERQAHIKRLLIYMMGGTSGAGGAKANGAPVPPPGNFCILTEDGQDILLEDAALGCIEIEH